MLKGGKKFNENFKIKTTKTSNTIAHQKEPGLLKEMEHSRTGVKNVLPGTFSITREQQSYQGLIGSQQKDTETIVKRVSQAKER